MLTNNYYDVACHKAPFLFLCFYSFFSLLHVFNIVSPIREALCSSTEGTV